MASIRAVARLGAAAFVAVLSLALPQTVGVCAADSDNGDSAAASAEQPHARPSRPPGRSVSTPAGRSAASATTRPQPAMSRAVTAVLPEPDLSIPEPAAEQTFPELDVSESARSEIAAVQSTHQEPNPDAPAEIPLRGATEPVAPPAPAAAARSAFRAVPDLAAVLSGGMAGHGPTPSTDTPLSWTVLAAAARETFGTPKSVAIPQTPLFTALRLQEIPVIGPLLVTPVVTIIGHIPVVSDLLHPIVGYPLLPDGVAAPRDVQVVSFDDTKINVHFLPAADLPVGRSAPTIFLASALGMPGATNLDGTPFDLILADLGGEIGIATLRQAGYNVVTWDPRGEYFSGGVLQIDSPDFEARDVSAIINWVAEQPEAQLDAPGDPRIGMSGASYGGGIQLVAAATDHRIDAIVPTISWNTLNSSIYKNDAFKTGSASSLAATLIFTLARFNSQILPLVMYGDFTGAMTEEGQDLLARSGPGAVRGYPDLVGQITAPTLLIQGTVDTLVGLKEADLTATTLLAQGVPTKVLWFCGGHGLCIHNVFDLSDGIALNQRTVEWFDRYVKGEPVSTGPGFEWVDQRGQHLSRDVYGPPSGVPLVAARTGDQVLALIPFVGGSGPMFLVLPIGGTIALNAVNLRTPVSSSTVEIVGEPRLTVTYSGTGTGEHVYAQLVDDTTGMVLGNQVTPVPVILDGQQHTVSLPLEPVAQTLRPGETVTLQLFSWSAAHAANASLGALTVQDIRISLPTNGAVAAA